MNPVALASTLVMSLVSGSGSAQLVAQSERLIEVPGGITDGVGRELYLTGEKAVDPHSGSVTMRSLPAEDVVPAPDWETRVDKLPKPVKELAMREGWAQARLDGARAYGRARQFEPGGRVLHVLQVVDVATGRLLWQRPIGEELPFPPRQ